MPLVAQDAALAKRMTEMHALQYTSVRHERKQDKKKQARLERKKETNSVSLAVAIMRHKQADKQVDGDLEEFDVFIKPS
jgi:hypothetical protein